MEDQHMQKRARNAARMRERRATLTATLTVAQHAAINADHAARMRERRATLTEEEHAAINADRRDIRATIKMHVVDTPNVQGEFKNNTEKRILAGTYTDNVVFKNILL